MTDDSFYIQIIVFFALSFFFSSSESALFSLRWWRLHALRHRAHTCGSLIAHLMENPRTVLITILVGNTFVNVAVSALIESRLESHYGGQGLWISIIITSFAVLLLGEITPKSLALYNPERYSLFIIRPLKFIVLVLTPAWWTIEKILNVIIPVFKKIEHPSGRLDRDEFLALVREGEREKILSGLERMIVENLVNLETIQVHQVMVHRLNMIALPVDSSYEEALQAIMTHDLRRIPLFRSSLDQITGILYAKDLLELKFNTARRKAIQSLARPPLFVPPTITLKDLYDQLIRKQLHMAVVLDEFGGTAGLITLEDILDRIFKKTDGINEETIQQRGEDGFELEGWTPLDAVKKLTGTTGISSDSRTVNGYILELTGRIPASGEMIQTPLGIFTITSATAQKIERLVFEPKDPSA